MQPTATFQHPGPRPTPCYRRDGKISLAYRATRDITPIQLNKRQHFSLSMIFAPRQPRHLRSGRRVTLQRIDSNNFTRNWVRSYKNTSSPPPCTTLPNSAQSCLVRLRRKHSAFSRELGPLRTASSVPGVVSAFIGVHRRPIWFSLNRQFSPTATKMMGRR